MSDSAVLDAGKVCDDGLPWCDGGGIPVHVVATTPAGTVTFDYASFDYEIGLDCATRMWLTNGASNTLPRLLVWLQGNPLCYWPAPDDYSATVDFQDCDGHFLETKGDVNVYANEVTRWDGGIEARLDLDLKVMDAGWRIDSRIQIPVLCGVGATK